MNPEVTISIAQPHKLNFWCPYYSIFITGIISLIIASFTLFIILELIKTVFHIKISKKRLFLYSILIIGIFSIVKNLFFGNQPVYLPFPLWATPIDCI